MKDKLKEILQLSLLAGATGFLFGDLIIGGIIWLIQSIKTGHWGSTLPLRMYTGIIFGLIGILIGPMLYFAKTALKKKKH